ncbi:MAG: DUF3127 domain-containing protein [Prevotella sp.]
MEISGKIIVVLQANSGVSRATGNPWMSQEYVLETHDQYPKKICFRVFGEDRIKNFNIQAGEEITVSFDVDAHEYNGRWFNSINAWAVNRNNAAQPASDQASSAASGAAQQSQAASTAMPFSSATEPAGGDSADDLPF